MIEMLQIRLDGYSALYDGQDWLVVGFSRWVRYHAVQTARAKMTDLGFPPPPEGSDPMPCLTQDRFFREHAVDRELQESFHQPHSAHELIRIASRPEVELLVVDGVVRKDTRTVQVTIQQA